MYFSLWNTSDIVVRRIGWLKKTFEVKALKAYKSFQYMYEYTFYLSRDMTKPTKWVCAKRRLRSAWASAKSDQESSLSAWRRLGPKLPIKRTATTLIRLGGCPGWSESVLGAQPLCWFCHVAAQFCMRQINRAQSLCLICFNTIDLLDAISQKDHSFSHSPYKDRHVDFNHSHTSANRLILHYSITFFFQKPEL